MCPEPPGPHPATGPVSVTLLRAVAEGQCDSGRQTLAGGTSGPGPGPVCESHNGPRDPLPSRERAQGGADDQPGGRP
ncbi:MAG: hypothetical protein ACI9CA_000562 [Natronomonas sp.]|jgi:hypothetical protein